MGTIETTYDLPRDLTIFAGSGTLTVDNFRECLASYYAGEVTGFVLWDLTRADLSTPQTTHLEELAQCIYRISEMRRGAKQHLFMTSPLCMASEKSFRRFQ